MPFPLEIDSSTNMTEAVVVANRRHRRLGATRSKVSLSTSDSINLHFIGTQSLMGDAYLTLNIQIRLRQTLTNQ